MEAVRTSETSLYSNETTRCYIAEGCHLHTRRHEILNIYKKWFKIVFFTAFALRWLKFSEKNFQF
jgi:hypothetical protein